LLPLVPCLSIDWPQLDNMITRELGIRLINTTKRLDIRRRIQSFLMEWEMDKDLKSKMLSGMLPTTPPQLRSLIALWPIMPTK